MECSTYGCLLRGAVVSSSNSVPYDHAACEAVSAMQAPRRDAHPPPPPPRAPDPPTGCHAQVLERLCGRVSVDERVYLAVRARFKQQLAARFSPPPSGFTAHRSSPRRSVGRRASPPPSSAAGSRSCPPPTRRSRRAPSGRRGSFAAPAPPSRPASAARGTSCLSLTSAAAGRSGSSLPPTSGASSARARGRPTRPIATPPSGPATARSPPSCTHPWSAGAPAGGDGVGRASSRPPNVHRLAGAPAGRRRGSWQRTRCDTGHTSLAPFPREALVTRRPPLPSRAASQAGDTAHCTAPCPAAAPLPLEWRAEWDRELAASAARPGASQVLPPSLKKGAFGACTSSVSSCPHRTSPPLPRRSERAHVVGGTRAT